MKKINSVIVAFMLLGATPAAATPSQNIDTYVVKKGDSMWRIATFYKVGLSEIIAANPQIKDPKLIYPGNKLNIPLRATDESILEDAMLKEVNYQRQQNGLKPLAIDWELSRVAHYKSNDMATNKYFSHNSPDYGTPFQMMQNFGIKYRAAGENIAQGQMNVKAVMAAWMASTGHRANILNPNYTHMGVGCVNYYWTQMFIQK